MNAPQFDPEDTAEFRLPETADASRVAAPVPISSGVTVDVAASSHRGLVRPINEDHYLTARIGRSFETLLSNLPEGSIVDRFDETGCALVVADGMGGRAGGEVASRLAISILVNLALHTPDWIQRPIKPELTDEILRRMAERYRAVDAALRAHAESRPHLAGMGTTMTLAISVGRELGLAHVGDSRAYLWRAGELLQLTRDQTLAQALEDRGVLSRDDDAARRFRHVLTGVLGGDEPATEAEIRRLVLTDNDRLILCTDGLTDMVDAETTASVLRGSPTPAAACHALVERALANGGRDNVTVVVADYRIAAAT